MKIGRLAQTIEVDNSTIEKNQAGELQLKLYYFKDSNLIMYNDSNDWFSSNLSNSFYTKMYEFIAQGDIYNENNKYEVEINADSSSEFDFRINGVSVLQGTHGGGGTNTRYFYFDMKKGDVLTMWGINTSSTFRNFRINGKIDIFKSIYDI